MESETSVMNLFLSAIKSPAVIVGALGYFVDIYDLVLFSIVRTKSLLGIGLTEEQTLESGVLLINFQMAGMLLGGLLWGILGDKKGRVSVLYGSIFLYSTANLLNAFVTNVEQYAALRFLAGIGLAGELGAAITLVSEVLTKEARGYGTTIVASVGVCGAMLAAVVGERLGWQMAYALGGILGFCLLIARIKTVDSGMFAKAKSTVGIRHGDFQMLFSPPARLVRYLACIAIGVPIWFTIGILITFAPELSRAMGLGHLEITGGHAIFYCYLGLAVGDLSSGLLSQWRKSRIRVTRDFLLLTGVGIFLYTFLSKAFPSAWVFYGVCGFLGVATGYWAMLVTISAEQFGTNLRATVATTVPNFVRGSVVPLTLSFLYLSKTFGLVTAAVSVGFLTIALALFSLRFLRETYGVDLDYYETS
jgi:MFS family permease